MHNLWLSLALGCLLTACSTFRPPKQPYTAYKIPAAPDYQDPANWSALPETKDYADTLPRDLPESLPENPEADVFFIHPTTFLEPNAWNASLTDKELNLATDQRAIKHQATAFNGAGRVFAPRYRQMTLGGFYGDDKASMAQALELAYTDIRAAFSYYLEHFNQGRPIVLAGHSQGSVHGIRLVKEFFDGQPLKDQLVAAYLLGWPFPADTFQTVPICDRPDQLGCAIGWCSWAHSKLTKGYEAFYQDAVVINPLTFTRDPELIPAADHEGFLMPNYKSFRRHSLEAQILEGYLGVSKPAFFITRKNYHIGDVNLFWLDIRKNVALRVNTYLEESTTANR